LKNIQESMGSQKTPLSESEKGKKGKKIIIRELVIKDARVSLTMSLFKKHTITAKLPDIHLKNIGQEQGGASPEQVAKVIISQIYAQIRSHTVMSTFNKKLKELGKEFKSIHKQAIQKIQNETQQKIKSVTGGKRQEMEKLVDQLKGFFNK